MQISEAEKAAEDWIRGGQEFQDSTPRYEHCRLLPTATDSPATIITTATEDDNDR